MDARRHTLQFKVQLRDIRPAIWRRIEVPAGYTFWDLHVAIQDAMGWLDYHLHIFRLRDPLTKEESQIGIPDPDPFVDEPDVLPGWEIPVIQYLKEAHDRAAYEYDFGDGWEHDLVLEAIGARQTNTKYPRCLAGARACPPEDCGGPGGYAELLKTIAKPTHPEYESMITWLGGPFDPEAFDPRGVKFDNPKRRWRVAFTNG
jgi:hypothetical protein